ncbi:MAG: portal protein, partial [Cetobacterium sp.]
NYITNTLLPRGSHWGRMDIDEELAELIRQKDNKIIQDRKRDSAKLQLEKSTEKLFKYINNSNYFDEIYGSIWDAVTMGTGIIKVNNTKNPAKPISFKNEGITNTYISEDPLGEIRYIFKEYKDFNFDEFKTLFPFGKWVDSDERVERKIDFIEYVIYQKGKWIHGVTTLNFDQELFLEKLDYNPFIIFRFRKHEFLSYGVGQGMWCLDYFRDLDEAMRLDREQLANAITPALIGYGDRSLFDSLVVRAGTLNYGGLHDHPSALRVSQVIQDPKINILKDQIERIKEGINKSFFVMPLGQLDSKNMTATEAQIRAEQFKTTFTGVYERLVNELLEPLIMNSVMILQANKIVDLETETIQLSKVVFINSISESTQWGEVNKLINVIQLSSQLVGQEAAAMMINKGKLRDYMVQKTGVNIEALNTTEEIAQEIEIQKQMMEQQVMMNGDNQMGAQENGAPTQQIQG